jgi:putative SbcD/Mre11-related phosphoesterase
MVSALIIEGPGGWLLTPEGAAVHLGERTAVIADVHLGYEWARGAGGDCLPTHTLAETIVKLGRLLARIAIDRLVVAGDLVESRRPCRRTDRDVATLVSWLDERGIRLIALEGNHDPSKGWTSNDALEVAGWTISHGHRPIAARKTISGHLHPVLRAFHFSTPCFLVGTSRIVLPAFSPNAAGVSIASLPVDRETLSCVAAAGDELLNFGPLNRLLGSLGARNGGSRRGRLESGRTSDPSRDGEVGIV